MGQHRKFFIQLWESIKIKNNIMEFLSPLRYPGGKAKVADFVQCLIKENALLDGTYVEPYVGGGSVALSLLFNEYVSDIHIMIRIYLFMPFGIVP